MTRKFSSLKDLYATLFFAGDARFDLYSSSVLIIVEREESTK